jgi:hypothetical protein
MLISHKHKFIFAHVWKTGGNSVRIALKPFSEELYPKKKSSVFNFNKKFKKEVCEPIKIDQHITLNEIQAILEPNKFSQYFKFAFVRNPLDLMVSYYHFITQKANNHPQKEFIQSLKGFEDYVKWSEENEMIRLSQHKFILDDQGKMLADYVGRYEHFQESFDEILKRLKIENIEIKKVNTSSHNHYLKYYNSTTEEIVRSVLSEDFRILKY